MKKFLFILCLLLPSIAFASSQISFNLSLYQSFDENEGQSYISPLKINLGDNFTKNLSFTIADKDFFIFGNDISNIKINDSKDNINTINLSNKNKKIEIVLNNEISGDLTINGIYIRTYDQKISDGKIGFDYNNDGKIDLYSQNYIELKENGRYSDNMRPLPVSDVKYNVIKNENGYYDVTFTWKTSFDLDIYGTLVKVNKNNSYGNIIEQFITKSDEQKFEYKDMDLEKDVYKFEIYSKDNYYSTEEPFIITLDKNYLSSIQEPTNIEETKDEENNTLCIQVISYAINPDNSNCETFNTPCDIPSNYEKVDICPVIIPQIEEIKKYEGNFSTNNKTILDKFTLVIDNFISKKIKNDITIEQKNQITEVRNKIIKQLENYDSAKNISEKKLVINDLIKLIIELKNVLK